MGAKNSDSQESNHPMVQAAGKASTTHVAGGGGARLGGGVLPSSLLRKIHSDAGILASDRARGLRRQRVSEAQAMSGTG
jgi:hypothetical protein